MSEAGVIVVSGYAPGVDMASHEAALKNGGRTIIVLPEGINHFRIKKTVKSLWDWGVFWSLASFLGMRFGEPIERWNVTR